MTDDKKKSLMDKMKKDKRVRKISDYLGDHWIEVVGGILMIVGIILAFFYMHVGGALVGFAVGICFFGEIRSYFTALRDYYTAEGLFKTLMLLGTALYLLIVLPAFLIAIAAGFGAMALVKWGAAV